MTPRRLLLTLATVTLYLLHQDIWFWRTARPLVFGFLPIGLFYHACFAVAATLLLASLVRFAWPRDLDDDETRARDDRGQEPEERASGIDSRERAGVRGVRRSTPRHDQ